MLIHLIGAASLLWCSGVSAEWQMVYKNDREGAALAGDKAKLVAAVRQGLPIRIAWGVQRSGSPQRTVEHVAEPVFVTVVNEQEVFVQIPEHIAQTSYWDEELQDFDTPAVVWRGLLATTGRFMAVWYNRATGQTIRRSPQRVVMTWFADQTATSTQDISPLWQSQ